MLLAVVAGSLALVSLAPPATGREPSHVRLPDAPEELLPPERENDALVRGGSPRAACLDAARRAEAVHGLPAGLLVAVALSESGLHAYALNISGRAVYPDNEAKARSLLRAASPRHAVMAGCVQVNANVHARGSDWPLDPVRSADWAGGMLRRWFLETGSWVEALRRWHGGSPASTRHALCQVRAKLEVTAPGSDLLADVGCGGTEFVRARRSGAALLEVAEAPEH